MRKIQITVYMFLALATAAFAYTGAHSGAEIDAAIDTVQTMSTYIKTLIDDTTALDARATLGFPTMTLTGDYFNIYAPDGSAAGGGISSYVFDPAPYF